MPPSAAAEIETMLLFMSILSKGVDCSNSCVLQSSRLIPVLVPIHSLFSSGSYSNLVSASPAMSELWVL